MQSEKMCRRYGTTNSSDAKRCASCGADLDTIPESGGSSADNDSALRHVDPNNRTELDRFESWDEAELACGLLRANGIACELSPMPSSRTAGRHNSVGAQPRCRTRMGAACRRGARVT
jgi:hypothetical protein